MLTASKKDTIKGIATRTVVIRGEKVTQYVAHLGSTVKGNTKRFVSQSKNKLVQKINDYYKQRQSLGAAADYVDPRIAFDALDAMKILEKAGLDESLSEAITRYVKLIGADENANLFRTPIGDIYLRYLSDRFDGKENTPDRQTTEARIGRFIRWFGEARKLSELTPSGVEEYLSNYDNATTYNGILSYLKSFVNWCTKPTHRYIGYNSLEHMELKTTVWKEPEFVSVADFTRLIRTLEGREMWSELGFIVLWFLAGMRDAEIVRVAKDPTAGTINLDDNVVRIVKVKGFTKGIRPRSFALEPSALAWLQHYPLLDSLCTTNYHTLRNRIKSVLAEINITLPRNAGRHSFITYHVAAYENVARTCNTCGTSAAMTVDHYRGLASKKDGEAYFAILPEA